MIYAWFLVTGLSRLFLRRFLLRCTLHPNPITQLSMLKSLLHSMRSCLASPLVSVTFRHNGRCVLLRSVLGVQITSERNAQTFWDSTGGLWGSGGLYGKYAGVFVSSNGHGGGQESTAIASMSTLAHHGISFVPLGYAKAFGQLTNVDEVHGGE